MEGGRLRVMVLEPGGTRVELAFDHDARAGESWARVSLSSARAALAGRESPAEVYLCLTGRDLFETFDRGFVTGAIRAARTHAWGARPYLVAQRIIPLLEEVHVAESDSVDAWFQAVHGAGARDLVQVSDVLSADRLRGASDTSSKRMAAIRRRAPDGPFRVIIDGADERGYALLQPFSATLSSDLTGARAAVVVIAAAGETSQVGTLRKAIDRVRLPIAFAAVVESSPTPGLQDLCRAAEIGLLRCKGWFELRFALEVLRELQAREAPPSSRTDVIDERIVEVEPAGARVFEAHARHMPSSLLVTSAYHPDGYASECLLASRGASELMDGAPRDTHVDVHPAISLDALPQLLDRSPRRTVWVHFGRGREDFGLQDASGRFHAPERWLRCFDGSRTSLALAVFSASSSVDVARRFAQAGTSVAIGFERDLDPRAAIEAYRAPVRAALLSGGDTRGILRAFGAARRSAYDASDPTAFYPKAAA